MIIDLILDRKDGGKYNPKDFYQSTQKYNITFHGIGNEILNAMDDGTEEEMQKALCNYIDKQNYNPDIKNYINSQNWLS